MKIIRTLSLPMSALLLLSCSANDQAKTEKVSTEIQSEEWTMLSEDSTLAQWEMYEGNEIRGWKWENGELQASGAGWDAGEDLITKQSYSNFELNLEWKIAEANSSGIFYLVEKSDSIPIYESAPEYQVLDDKGWPTEMKPNQLTAGSYAMYAPEGAEVKPVGEWNTTKIIVHYPHVEHWLNGKKVVEYEFGSEDWTARKAADKWAEVPGYGLATSGHIGLQNAGLVTYRNVKIKEL
ncbi:DUF1080 domain-containing protein [Algoriphagus jejuensis]|uniref:DUF1080 domain-containing protein n=1 Tax=Algoriphagus jejuensis TaxID=419934 RepID=A0ABP3Y968_9BACT